MLASVLFCGAGDRRRGRKVRVACCPGGMGLARPPIDPFWERTSRITTSPRWLGGQAGQAGQAGWPGGGWGRWNAWGAHLEARGLLRRRGCGRASAQHGGKVLHGLRRLLADLLLCTPRQR